MIMYLPRHRSRCTAAAVVFTGTIYLVSRTAVEIPLHFVSPNPENK